MASNNADARPHATFSVVIPTYQRERIIGRAIESAIAQTLPADEIIVVDDGSTDSTQRVLQTFTSVRSVRQPQSGSAAARNRGVRKRARAGSHFSIRMTGGSRTTSRASPPQ